VTTELSSYIDYLPRVLSSPENDPSQFLGRLLRVFEKILTGIPDGITIGDGNHERQPIEKTIDELSDLFTPWRTRPDMLPWLASWVALTLREEWSEYQSRKLISEMVSIYQQRGLKQGLYTYLDIYANSQVRPRIAIDDGEALFRATLREDGASRLHALAYSHTIPLSAAGSDETTTLAVLLHPSAVAVDRQNDYIVADEGGGEEKQWDPALWKVSSTGEVDYSSKQGALPLPRPLHIGSPLEKPSAVIIDNQDRYNVLDIGKATGPADQDAAIYRLSPPKYEISTMIKEKSFKAVYPVDMVLDASGRFIVLDRGWRPRGFPPEGPSKPKIVVVTEGQPVEEHSLEDIAEPTALAMDGEERFIIADARDQRTLDPADLVLLDPANGWQPLSLLAQVDQNPLIFPTGLVYESPQSLLVCDTGVRWGYSKDQSNRALAELAAIYRVDLSKTPPEITKVMRGRKLVNPSKMTMDRSGNLIVADRGEAYRRGSEVKREWRARAGEFGVVVHFSQQRPTETEDRNWIRRGIANIVEDQRPGHTSWWMEY
jgi:phage tail-like protein